MLDLTEDELSFLKDIIPVLKTARERGQLETHIRPNINDVSGNRQLPRKNVEETVDKHWTFSDKITALGAELLYGLTIDAGINIAGHLTHVNTAERTWTFPDHDGTVLVTGTADPRYLAIEDQLGPGTGTGGGTLTSATWTDFAAPSGYSPLILGSAGPGDYYVIATFNGKGGEFRLSLNTLAGVVTPTIITQTPAKLLGTTDFQNGLLLMHFSLAPGDASYQGVPVFQGQTSGTVELDTNWNMYVIRSIQG